MWNSLFLLGGCIPLSQWLISHLVSGLLWLLPTNWVASTSFTNRFLSQELATKPRYPQYIPPWDPRLCWLASGNLSRGLLVTIPHSFMIFPSKQYLHDLPSEENLNRSKFPMCSHSDWIGFHGTIYTGNQSYFPIFSMGLSCRFSLKPIHWHSCPIGYIPNYSHLIGIMISKTIGFRGTLFSDTPKFPNVFP